MFYETSRNDHGLPHDPIKSCVVPRPIGWISTRSAAGILNLAPYSFFNLVATSPALVMYASNGRTPYGEKDTVTNIAETGEFVVNMATWNQRSEMFASSASLPPQVDEFAHAGLETLPSRLVKPPRVAGAPIHLECVHYQTIELPHDDPGSRNVLVIGRVVGVHIDDAVIENGRIDLGRIHPIARLGYGDYARVDNIFSLGFSKAPRGV
jgi:flavin reductase (DIM6/NTAB) family NADH-FMN oxidoreductase RutF